MAEDDVRSDRDRPLPATEVRQGGISAGSAEAQQIIDQNRDVAGSFIHAQRQAVKTSTLDIHKATFSSPDLDITYRNHFGEETIEYTAYPKPVPEEPEVPFEPPDIPAPPEFTPYFPPVVTTSKYLLVLYKTDKLAAIPMLTIASATPFYLATAPGSNWGDIPIKVAQYMFGKTGVIFTPIDFTGKTSPATYVLSTTLLSDGKTSTLQNSVPPVLAGDDKGNIYTSLDTFNIDAKGKLVYNGPVAEFTMPYAIDGNGMYYYNISLSVNQAYQYGNGMIDETVYLALFDHLQDNIQKTAEYNTIPQYYLIVATTGSHDSDNGQYPVGIQFQLHYNTKGAFIDNNLPCTSYGSFFCYGSSNLGGIPTLTAYDISRTAQWVTDDTNAWVKPGTAKPDITLEYPYPIYTVPDAKSAGKDQLDSPFQMINGSYTDTSAMPMNTNPHPLVTVGYAPDPFPDPDSLGFATGVQIQFQSTIPGAVLTNGFHPPGGFSLTPPYPITLPANWVSIDPICDASTTVNFGFPVLAASVNAYFAALGGLHTYDVVVPPDVLSQTLEFLDYSGTTADTAGAFVYQPFPPSLDKTPPGGHGQWYYSVNNLDTRPPQEIHTPYEVFTTSDADHYFMPWLHVSNGQHYAQGYYTGSSPDLPPDDDSMRLYLDGKDYLTLLAKSLNCKKTDIKAIFMDIDLQAIVTLSNIQVAAWSEGGGGV